MTDFDALRLQMVADTVRQALCELKEARRLLLHHQDPTDAQVIGLLHGDCQDILVRLEDMTQLLKTLPLPVRLAHGGAV